MNAPEINLQQKKLGLSVKLLDLALPTSMFSELASISPAVGEDTGLWQEGGCRASPSSRPPRPQPTTVLSTRALADVTGQRSRAELTLDSGWPKCSDCPHKDSEAGRRHVRPEQRQ